MKHRSLARQAGFTLVEIAIVLVIIGLLLGGVLKGQELIKSAKVKAYKSNADAITVALNGYLERFRALPGDDHAGHATQLQALDFQNDVVAHAITSFQSSACAPDGRASIDSIQSTTRLTDTVSKAMVAAG